MGFVLDTYVENVAKRKGKGFNVLKRESVGVQLFGECK